jgi:hypothetical protein
MAKGQTLGERVTAVETWAEGHDKACASRWGVLITIMLIGLTTIIGIGGWSLNRVFEGQERQLAELRQIRAETLPKAR